MGKGRKRAWWWDVWGRHKLFIIALFIQVILATYMLSTNTDPTPTKRVRDHSINPHLLFVGIISDISSSQLRNASRETWLKLSIPEKATFKYKFVVGKPECVLNKQQCDKTTLAKEKQLAEESEKYKDILRVDVKDSDPYRAKKLWATFEWLSQNLEFHYFVKVQHDTFLRLDLISEELHRRPKRNTYWSGFVWKDKTPELPPNSAMPLNFKFDKIPPYPDGESFIMSSDIVYDIAANYPIWFLPDLGQSLGFWMLPFNITLVHDSRFQTGDVCHKAMFTKCNMTPKEMKLMYKNIQDGDLCEGFSLERCPLCFECLPEQAHWSFSGLICSESGALETGIKSDANDSATENIVRFLPMLRCERRKLEDVPLAHNLLQNGELKHTNSLEWDIYDWKFIGSSELVTKPDMGEDPLDSCVKLTGAIMHKVSYITQQITFDRPSAEPLVVSAWSKAEDIGDVNYGDYAVFIDVTYTDGSREYPFVVNFEGGTHGWQYNFRVFRPPKPVARFNIFCMLRSPQGEAFFDDIFVGYLSKHMCELKHQSQYFSGFLTEVLEKSSARLPVNMPIAGGALPREQTQSVVGDRQGLTTEHIHTGDEIMTTTTSSLAKGNKFVLIWTSPVGSFKLRHRRVIESIYYHHPDATVHVYSNSLPIYFFHKFASAGYNIKVIRYDLHSLISGLPGTSWEKQLDEWRNGKYYSAHLSDFLRFVILYRYGGIYLDIDSILLRPVDMKNALGSEPCGDTFCKSLSSDTKLTSQLQYFFPTGFMSFEKNHSLLLQTLRYFDSLYDPSLKQAGSIFLSLAYSNVKKKDLSKMHLKVLPAKNFFPVSESEISNYFEKDNEDKWESIAGTSYTFHFWDYKTQDLEIDDRSLMWRALNQFSISNMDSKHGIQL